MKIKYWLIILKHSNYYEYYIGYLDYTLYYIPKITVKNKSINLFLFINEVHEEIEFENLPSLKIVSVSRNHTPI